MKSKLMFLTLTLMLVLGCSQMALAAGTGNHGFQNRACSKDANWIPLAEKLSLSDRQVQQVKEINLNTYKTTKVLKTKMMDAKFDRRQLMIDGKDKSAIAAKNKEIANLRNQIQKEQQQKWQQIQSILTPEQQSKLKEMKDFGKHGGHCQQGGPKPE